MTEAPSIRIRTMTPGDVAAGLRLCRAARWNQTDRDWQHFLTEAPDGALVAEENGDVIGTVATLPYGPFSWVSMVLVDPAARGRGIGTTLLERGLGLVPEAVAPRLDATPLGEPLYRRIGFAGEYGLERWLRDATGARPGPRHGARPLSASDWPRILELDVRAFGASRERLLRRLAADALEYAWVLDDGRSVRGYLFGRHGHVREHIGPLVARDGDAARILLKAGLAEVGDRPVFVDVPVDQQPLRALLFAEGFAVERPFLRMFRGRLTAPGDSALVFAIAGPEFG